MASFTAYVEWNDHDVTVEVTANMEWNDYGVPGSPRWLSPEDIQWGSYDVDGVELTAAQMVEQFGQDAVNELDALLEAKLDDAEWEEEEPDYDDCREYDEY